MADATFAIPDVTTFARLDALGLRVTGPVLGAGPGGVGLPGCQG